MSIIYYNSFAYIHVLSSINVFIRKNIILCLFLVLLPSRALTTSIYRLKCFVERLLYTSSKIIWSLYITHVSFTHDSTIN